ncbi:hypothetical protein AA0472_1087 [Acetobacter estunensis NRIC 0472]|nr:hypothetical protein AA0472_1087 [Acetobacter estunensis NRIC 0472]
MRAPHGEAFLTQHTHKRPEQPIISREKRATESREDSRTFRIGSQIAKRRPPHRANENDVSTSVRTQLGEYLTGRRQPHPGMRPRRDNGRLSKILKGNHEHRSPLCSNGRRHLPRQWAASSENTDTPGGVLHTGRHDPAIPSPLRSRSW